MFVDATSQKIVMTLCLVSTDTQVLLGMKKRGFGEGRWNGFGGKVQQGETILEAAQRELEEEAGIRPQELEYSAVMRFHFPHDPDVEVHLFRVSGFTGEPQESDEMQPRWFLNEQIPFEEMWPDDQYWVPLFLERKRFRADFWFQDVDTLLRHSIDEDLLL